MDIFNHRQKNSEKLFFWANFFRGLQGYIRDTSGKRLEIYFRGHRREGEFIKIIFGAKIFFVVFRDTSGRIWKNYFFEQIFCLVHPFKKNSKNYFGIIYSYTHARARTHIHAFLIIHTHAHAYTHIYILYVELEYMAFFSVFIGIIPYLVWGWYIKWIFYEKTLDKGQPALYNNVVERKTTK